MRHQKNHQKQLLVFDFGLAGVAGCLGQHGRHTEAVRLAADVDRAQRLKRLGGELHDHVAHGRCDECAGPITRDQQADRQAADVASFDMSLRYCSASRMSPWQVGASLVRKPSMKVALTL